MSSSSIADELPSARAQFDPKKSPAVLIMAAGTGNRLWPMSVVGRPKQFLALVQDNETMLQTTLQRALLMTSIEHIYVTVAPGMADMVMSQCPELPSHNILVLPEGSDTLVGVAYASAAIEARAPRRVLILMAADNFIDDTQAFVRSCNSMMQAACHSGQLVSLGIEPTFAAEMYGYMRLGESSGLAADAYRGLGYIEKPPRQMAERLAVDGQHLWNSGIFAWRPDSFFAALKSVSPQTAQAADKLRAAAQTNDADLMVAATLSLPNLSLDHGLMEKLEITTEQDKPQHTFVRGHFAWDDVGSYAALRAHLTHDTDGVATRGLVDANNCRDCSLINLSKNTLRVSGLQGCVVVVGSQNELLVSSHDHTHLLRQRGSLHLYPGTAVRGIGPNRANADAAGNSCDAPVAFAAASHCQVTGATQHNVLFLGVHAICAHITSEGTTIKQNVVPNALSTKKGPRHHSIGISPNPPPLSLTLCADRAAVAHAVAEQVVQDLTEALEHKLRPAVVFSAGATPVGVYRLLAGRYRNVLPWQRIRLLQMDAYSGLDAQDPVHFHWLLQRLLVQPLGLSARWLTGDESDAEMQQYERDILQSGGIDLVLHGIGRNGHLGFNEPGADFKGASRLVTLDVATREDFALTQKQANVVPRMGVTLGLKVLNAAQRVRVMALGEAKRHALVNGTTGAISPELPLSSLQRHNDVMFFADKAAWLPQW